MLDQKSKFDAYWFDQFGLQLSNQSLEILKVEEGSKAESVGLFRGLKIIKAIAGECSPSNEEEVWLPPRIKTLHLRDDQKSIHTFIVEAKTNEAFALPLRSSLCPSKEKATPEPDSSKTSSESSVKIPLHSEISIEVLGVRVSKELVKSKANQYCSGMEFADIWSNDRLLNRCPFYPFYNIVKGFEITQITHPRIAGRFGLQVGDTLFAYRRTGYWTSTLSALEKKSVLEKMEREGVEKIASLLVERDANATWRVSSD